MTTLPFADPGRAAFEKIDDYNNALLLISAFPAQTPTRQELMPVSTTFPQFAVLGLDSARKLAWATEGYADGAKASGALTFSGAGTAAETVTVGARVYTLVTALTAANQVLIGASAAATALNLIAAINGDVAQAGVAYHALTVPHADVSARSNGAGVVGLVAHDTGIAGNSIATTETSAAASFGAATLTGGLDSLGVKAEFILSQSITSPASGVLFAPVWNSGHYNMSALKWHPSFTTDAAKKGAFYGGRSNNIVIDKRA